MKVELDKVREIIRKEQNHVSPLDSQYFYGLQDFKKGILDKLDKLDTEESTFCKGEPCKHFKGYFKMDSLPKLIACDKVHDAYILLKAVNCGDYEPKDQPEPCAHKEGYHDLKSMPGWEQCNTCVSTRKKELKLWLHWYRETDSGEVRQLVNGTELAFHFVKFASVINSDFEHIKTEPWVG